MADLAVSGSFDDLRPCHIRYLEDLGNRGRVGVLLWSDALVRSMERKDPTFSQDERKYFLDAIRFVDRVEIVDSPKPASEVLRRPGSSVERATPLAQAKKVLVAGSFHKLHPQMCDFSNRRQILAMFMQPSTAVQTIRIIRKSLPTNDDL